MLLIETFCHRGGRAERSPEPPEAAKDAVQAGLPGGRRRPRTVPSSAGRPGSCVAIATLATIMWTRSVISSTNGLQNRLFRVTYVHTEEGKSSECPPGVPPVRQSTETVGNASAPVPTGRT